MGLNGFEEDIIDSPPLVVEEIFPGEDVIPEEVFNTAPEVVSKDVRQKEEIVREEEEVMQQPTNPFVDTVSKVEEELPKSPKPIIASKKVEESVSVENVVENMTKPASPVTESTEKKTVPGSGRKSVSKLSFDLPDSYMLDLRESVAKLK